MGPRKLGALDFLWLLSDLCLNFENVKFHGGHTAINALVGDGEGAIS